MGIFKEISNDVLREAMEDTVKDIKDCVSTDDEGRQKFEGDDALEMLSRLGIPREDWEALYQRSMAAVNLEQAIGLSLGASVNMTMFTYFVLGYAYANKIHLDIDTLPNDWPTSESE